MIAATSQKLTQFSPFLYLFETGLLAKVTQLCNDIEVLTGIK